MEDNLFKIKVVFQKKLFVNQKSAEVVLKSISELAANSVEEMKQQLWDLAMENNLLEKEVIVDGENFAWSADNPTDIDEIDKFIIVYDKVGRRPHKPSLISTDLLTSLRNKEVNVYFYVYSTSISTKAVYTNFKKALIDPVEKDKAAADTSQRLFEIAGKLKEHHSYHLFAGPMVWNIWANNILSQPSHSHEDLIVQHPPDHILHLFRAVATQDSEIIASNQNGLRVARYVSNTNKNDLKDLRSSVNEVKNVLQILCGAVENLDQKLSVAERMAERENDLVEEMANTMHVDAHLDSFQFEEVDDLEDMDHS